VVLTLAPHVDLDRGARRDLLRRRLAVHDLDRETRRIAERHLLPASGVRARRDGARAFGARESFELGARRHGEARPDEARLRCALHAVDVGRRRRAAHVEDVTGALREQQAEVTEEVFGALEVRALEDEEGERRRPRRGVRVPRWLLRRECLHVELLVP
jgi:hypothetical protein